MKKRTSIPYLVYLMALLLLFSWANGAFGVGKNNLSHAQIVDLFERKLEEHGLQDDVMLTGSFCIGKCNRYGVTVQVDDEIHTGVTPENFEMFFVKNILEAVKKG